jgi:phage replication-related protein YjqB (UPF0714/DUF867 family)
MAKAFNSFAELVLNSDLNLDYRVLVVDRGVSTTIVCIHGGAIEPLTSELAAAIAGSEYNLYDLQGLRSGDNSALRIPVARFDEVRLFTLLKRSQVALCIDGAPGLDSVVHVGGSNALLKQILREQLSQSDFQVCASHTTGAAHDPARFYNASLMGGVLLELSAALRAEMTLQSLISRGWQQPSSWQEPFFRFAAAVRSALQTHALQAASDVTKALSHFEATTSRMPPELRSNEYHG